MKSENYRIPDDQNKGLTPQQELEIRELIAASLANWTGITRFRTIESTTTTISDFTDSQHNHTNAAGGGQLTAAALSSAVTVPKGGTGLNTVPTGAYLVGAGAGTMTTVTPLSGTGTFYAAASSGGAVNVKFDYSNGVITART